VVTEFQASGNLWGITAVSGSNILWFTEETSSKVGYINPISGSTAAVVEYPTPTASSGPRGITRGPDGNVWYAGDGSNKIGRVNTTTAMFTEFVVPTPGAVPAQIVTGPDNNLWFTEEIANRIGRLAP
jgi:virginiamycin B lyase